MLVGRADVVKQRHQARRLRRERCSKSACRIRRRKRTPYIDALYKRLQRRGALYRDAVRMVTNDRNIYAASMLAAGDADAMVTGVTRNYATALSDVRLVLDPPAGQRPMGVLVIFAKGRVVFDRRHQRARNADLRAAGRHRHPGRARWRGASALTPRVAMLASSTFGFPRSERSERIVEAVQILDKPPGRFRI